MPAQSTQPMDSMSDLFPALDAATSPSPAASGGSSGGDAGRIAEVRAFLTSHFDAAGRPVPSFEYTPRSVAHLHPLATLSLARSRSAAILAADLRLKAAEYRSQAARLREILDAACLSHERLPPAAIAHAQVLAGVANLLNIRDTEMTSFIVAMGDLFLRKSDVEEKRGKVDKESKELLDYTRKAIAKLNDLKKILMKFENEIAARQGQMLQWQKNLALMDQKEKQYVMEEQNWKALLKRCGYTPEINHGVLMEMAEHKKDLERRTKPILDTLRSYQDLPPDKALAALAIEDKKRQYAAAEKYLDEVLQSALTTPGS